MRTNYAALVMINNRLPFSHHIIFLPVKSYYKPYWLILSIKGEKRKLWEIS